MRNTRFAISLTRVIHIIMSVLIIGIGVIKTLKDTGRLLNQSSEFVMHDAQCSLLLYTEQKLTIIKRKFVMVI